MDASADYKGQTGGLYADGRNDPPEKHMSSALVAAKQITPLDADGKPAANGKIVFVSLGMSNTAAEFVTFKKTIGDSDPDKAPAVALVNCAVGGAGARSWASGGSRTWELALSQLREAGASPEQVQAAWIKHAEAMPEEDQVPLQYAKVLKTHIEASIRLSKARFPNLRIAYLSSRTYGGYNATGVRRVNPEPFAYETAFAVRWVIQEQINGSSLNHDSRKGPVVAPVLLWGPYLWADGVNPRKSDGLKWERPDFGNDGVHLSRESGAPKVARMLLDFLKNERSARLWFLKK